MEKAKSFRDLSVWQKSHKFTIEVYGLTATFPISERFSLVAQMRRAAVSVAANIAEGFAKKGIKNKLNFYNISQGSLEELKYYFILARDLGFCMKIDDSITLLNEVGKC